MSEKVIIKDGDKKFRVPYHFQDGQRVITKLILKTYFPNALGLQYPSGEISELVNMDETVVFLEEGVKEYDIYTTGIVILAVSHF